MSKKDFSSIACPKGVFDIFPNDPTSKTYWQDSNLWQFVEESIRSLCDRYQFSEIRTPIFEKKALFQRGVGEDTDIVSKEMYTFLDRKERELCLRPEGTASVIRAFIEERLDLAPTQRYYYIGPMFRYERQQRGRYRQHHQFGVEVFGSHSPFQDVECIEMLYRLYMELGLKNLSLQINSLGDASSREIFRDKLISFLKPHVGELSEDSQVRFKNNPLRILDSKDKKDKEIIKDAPQLFDCLSDASAKHFEQVLKTLELLKIPYEINHKLVRGLDYYCDTVFEIQALSSQASQNSLGGGGRYNDLVENLGGPALPGIGFATGIERVIQTLIEQKASLPEKKQAALHLIPLDEEAQSFCLNLATDLRSKGVSVGVSFTKKKLKQQLSQLEKTSPKHVAIIGSKEIEEGKCLVKNWITREERTHTFSELSDSGVL